MKPRTATASHWGTYWVEDHGTDGIRLAAIEQDPQPSEIGAGWLSSVRHPSRIGRPAVRQGYLESGRDADRNGRGAEPFVEVPWDTALDLAAEALNRVRTQHGNEAIYGGSYGWASAGRFHHAQSQIHRFLNCIGGYTGSYSNYSHAAADAFVPHVVGHFNGVVVDGATSWEAIAGHCELMVMFGGMPVKNAQINAGAAGRHTLAHWLDKSRASGTAFVTISPIRADAPEGADAEWMAPRPNTDTALMLGLAHTLWTEGLADREFLDTYTTGFHRFLPYLKGETDGIAKDADWAAEICDLDADAIRALARRMAAKRSMITVTWSLQRADHGEQPCWMAITLAAMLGGIGLPGGGFGIGYSCANGVGNPTNAIQFPAFPQGKNPIRDRIPVARISDALLHPGGAYRFNGQDKTYPDLRLVYWAGGNPFHHHQDLNRLVRAFRQPDTVIVNELHWTATAKYADIVFPATSPLERRDIAMARWDPMMVAMEPVLPPQGDARDDYDIFGGIARRLDVADAFTEGRNADEWIEVMWQNARCTAGKQGVELPDLKNFREQGMLERVLDADPPVLLADFRADPKAAPLSTPSGKIEIYSETIAGFGYESCPGHPTWIPPLEWLGALLAQTYPLHLISNQPRYRLHGQLDCGDTSIRAKIKDREPVTLNPADASDRGIRNGDIVRIFNDRGACLAGAVLSDDVAPGVVQLATGAWFDPEDPADVGSVCKHGNPNVLTRDQGTSELGQGPSAHSALVEVERFSGEPPKVSAFDPPELLEWTQAVHNE